MQSGLQKNRAKLIDYTSYHMIDTENSGTSSSVHFDNSFAFLGVIKGYDVLSVPPGATTTVSNQPNSLHDFASGAEVQPTSDGKLIGTVHAIRLHQLVLSLPTHHMSLTSALHNSSSNCLPNKQKHTYNHTHAREWPFILNDRTCSL